MFDKILHAAICKHFANYKFTTWRYKTDYEKLFFVEDDVAESLGMLAYQGNSIIFNWKLRSNTSLYDENRLKHAVSLNPSDPEFYSKLESEINKSVDYNRSNRFIQCPDGKWYGLNRIYSEDDVQDREIECHLQARYGSDTLEVSQYLLEFVRERFPRNSLGDEFQIQAWLNHPDTNNIHIVAALNGAVQRYDMVHEV